MTPLWKNCILHVSGNPFTDWKIRKDFAARWDLLRYRKSPRDEKLNEITKSIEASSRKSHFKSQEFRKPSGYKFKLVQHPGYALERGIMSLEDADKPYKILTFAIPESSH